MKPSIKLYVACGSFGLIAISFIALYCFPMRFCQKNSLALSEGGKEMLVTLSGKLDLKLFPGPPEYSSIEEGDRADYCWILQLDRPSFEIATTTPVVEPANDLNHILQKAHQNEILLSMDEDLENRCREYLEQEIVCVGLLFHAHTTHHYTPILMEVKNVMRNGTLVGQ